MKTHNSCTLQYQNFIKCPWEQLPVSSGRTGKNESMHGRLVALLEYMIGWSPKKSLCVECPLEFGQSPQYEYSAEKQL